MYSKAHSVKLMSEDVIEVRCVYTVCGSCRWHHAICFQLFHYFSVLFQVTDLIVCELNNFRTSP